MLVTINRVVHQRAGGRCPLLRSPRCRDHPPQQGQIRSPHPADRRRRTTDRRARATSRCGWRTSAPRQVSAGRRSTGTSPTRRRCWSSCWSGSAPDCWPARPTSSRRAATPASALDGLIDFHLDFALGESDLIRIQDRDLGNLPARGQAPGAQGATAVRRDLGRRAATAATQSLAEADARLMAHADFGLLNSTPHSVKPGTAKTAEASSRTVLRDDDGRGADLGRSGRCAERA